MNYLELLENSYAMERSISECPPQSKLDYLGEYIFNFTTYDSEISALFACRAVEVCKAIRDKATFDYAKDPENYRWYLLMCNMPFFADRLEWGTSIRGAWWSYQQPALNSCALWSSNNQISNLKFDRKEWLEFISALIDFAQPKEAAR